MLSRYIATSLHQYIISSFVPPQELPPYHGLSLHCYFATSVHHFFFCSPTRASTILCSLATLLLRYIGISFLLLFPHKSFHHTMLSRYIATLLHCYIATSLHCYIAYSGILWHTLAYSCILATLLLRYIGTSFLLLFPHKSFHHTMLSWGNKRRD